jgi:hypothetical protein
MGRVENKQFVLEQCIAEAVVQADVELIALSIARWIQTDFIHLTEVAQINPEAVPGDNLDESHERSQKEKDLRNDRPA